MQVNPLHGWSMPRLSARKRISIENYQRTGPAPPVARDSSVPPAVRKTRSANGGEEEKGIKQKSALRVAQRQTRYYPMPSPTYSHTAASRIPAL